MDTETMEEWAIPYTSTQVDTIIEKYKNAGFPSSKVIAIIKRLPWNLAASVVENQEVVKKELLNEPGQDTDINQIQAAAEEHDMYRQEIVHKMKSLILEKSLIVSSDSVDTPLQKLEGGKTPHTREYRFIRKHFPFLLPKRKWKKKKRSKAKLERKNKKQKEKKIAARLAKANNKQIGKPTKPTADQTPSTSTKTSKPKPGVSADAMRAHFKKIV